MLNKTAFELGRKLSFRKTAKLPVSPQDIIKRVANKFMMSRGKAATKINPFTGQTMSVGPTATTAAPAPAQTAPAPAPAPIQAAAPALAPAPVAAQAAAAGPEAAMAAEGTPGLAGVLESLGGGSRDVMQWLDPTLTKGIGLSDRSLGKLIGGAGLGLGALHLAGDEEQPQGSIAQGYLPRGM